MIFLFVRDKELLLIIMIYRESVLLRHFGAHELDILSLESELTRTEEFIHPLTHTRPHLPVNIKLMRIKGIIMDYD